MDYTKHYTERDPDYSVIIDTADVFYNKHKDIIVSPAKVIKHVEQNMGRQLSGGELSAIIDDYIERANNRLNRT